jgi:hypothetical protein
MLIAATVAALLGLASLGKKDLHLLPVVHAQDQSSGCSLASLNGPYALERVGTIVGQLPGFPPPPAQFGEVNIATFDGAGSFSGSAVVNIGGAVLNPVTFNGTYTVNADCSGTDTVFTGVGVTLHNSIVVTGGGRRFISTQTDPWAVVQARGQRLGD